MTGPGGAACLHYRSTFRPLFMTSTFTVTASRGRHAARRNAKKENGGGEAGGGGGGGARRPGAAGGRGRWRRRVRTVGARPRALSRSGRWWWIGGLAVVAGLAYVPLLAVRPGVITPDTKTYLYLDPTRFLSQVAFMWNPTVGLGTVNHQYIGYLLPMGPFFAVFHRPRRARLGGPAPVAGLDPVRRGTRRPLSLAHPRAEGAGAHGGRPGLHAVAVLPAVRRADLGDPAAVGGPAVHAGPDHRGPAPGRLAGAGACSRSSWPW